MSIFFLFKGELHLALTCKYFGFHQMYRQYWIPAFSNDYTHRLTEIALNFIVFITLKWYNFAGSSSSHNITLQINQCALI